MSEVTNGSSTAKPRASPEAVVDRLFKLLHAMYGRAWVDKWEGAPVEFVKGEWARSIDGFEMDTIRMAVESLKTEGKPFPPNLPEFVFLCRQFVRHGPHRLRLASPRYEPPENIFAKLKRELKA